MEILIGGKSVEKYVLAVLIQKEKNKEITLKARGKHIPKAIRVADMARQKTGMEIKDVKISVDYSEENPEKNSPAIEIKLVSKS